MAHCTIQPLTLSKLPHSFAFHHKPSSTPKHLLLSRSVFLRNVRATVSDEKRDGVVTLEADKNGYNEILENDFPKEEFSLLDKVDFKFEVNDTTSLVVYAGGAITTLWLSSVLIGAIDSIPVIPKLLEVVGLGYSLWFTYRYLLFKRNRDELSAKVEELKEQVLGSEDSS